MQWAQVPPSKASFITFCDPIIPDTNCGEPISNRGISILVRKWICRDSRIQIWFRE